MKKLTINDIQWEVICEPEDIPVRGYCTASCDDEFARQCEDKIISDLEWNEWAWCSVEVRGTWNGLESSDYLGCCSYASEADFRENSGYFEDMQNEVLRQIQTQAESIVDAMN